MILTACAGFSHTPYHVPNSIICGSGYIRVPLESHANLAEHKICSFQKKPTNDRDIHFLNLYLPHVLLLFFLS